MALIGRILWAGCVWLTALLTLVAGFPFLECHCPNGQVKPFCIGSVARSSASGCCCGGSCCLSTNGDKCCQASDVNETSTCCKNPTPASPGDSPNGYRADTSCCVKTLAASRGPWLLLQESVATSNLTSVSNFDCPVLTAVVELPTNLPVRNWQMHFSSPPCNRVTLLQRLII